MTTVPSIAIVGAGPGGLMLARLLHLQGLSCTVFERDRHRDERPQGGTLDLHAGSGQHALTRAGLREPFLAVARHEDQGMRLIDHHGTVLMDMPADGTGDRPEVDRTALRDLLLDALPTTTVRWGQSVQALAQQHDGRWQLQTGAGNSGPFDLVVGADGAWSRIRPLLSPYLPQYSGLTFIEFGIDDVDRAHPALATLVGHGKAHVEGLGMALIIQRNGNAHLRGYAVFRVPEDWAPARFDTARPQQMRQALRETFSGYADAVRALFDASNDHFAIRPIHALPVGHCWNPRSGLTLLGDAAHVMSPFGGEGANNALLDAAELAHCLQAAPRWQDAVMDYERRMFVRTTASAALASEGAATFLSHDGVAQSLRDHLAHHAPAHSA
ncbi:NAD(P)/FAD-dependent oxidoreductase [Stenotrophomonas sp. 24(2023)]|uniref:FAD-dependent oxidoreductase n=1 Tax=Stenotrophomonas sp. 24(2023) TaxID=3068324 RepID=UPI0027E0D0F7|nr:NAD(P)/FAD-dependent oxidoreductase [Stenotrophomonas sp. 24(2023)]WMJ68961.1 NAD(P)/FAD-dependent oxidoreductase [Stenotrophomonas sp. 24(2023)]